MKILEPVVALIGRISFRNKLRITAVVFGIPLLIASAGHYITLNAGVTRLQTEQSALNAQLPLQRLLGEMHQFLAVKQALDEGATGLENLGNAAQERLLAAIATSSTATISLPALNGDGIWLGRWSDISELVRRGDTAQLADVVVQLRVEVDKINEKTGLLIDGDADTSRLLGVLTGHFAALLHDNGMAARHGAVTLVKKSLRGSRRSELTMIRGNFNALVQWSMDAIQKVAANHPDIAPSLGDAAGRLNTAYLPIQEALTTKMLDTTDFDMDPAAFLGLTATAMTESLAIGELLASQTGVLLDERLTALKTQRNLIVLSMLAGLVMVVAGFLAAYISIMRGLDGLSGAVTSMAAGNLEARAAVCGTDELGDVAVQFNRMAESLAERTAQLKEKSNDIHTMLQNMPQGILTIVAGGKIHPEYSAYLEAIFQTRAPLAGIPAVEFLFTETAISANTADQIATAVSACLGEDRMNFDFNKHLLVVEAVRKFPDGSTKTLDFSWSPICNDEDVTEKILVCVRDVTELRKLEDEARHQKQELEMVGQLLAISQEKYHAFSDSAAELLGRNRELISHASVIESDTIAELFRNMHTVKGNARTLGLATLTNSAHMAEQAYDALRQGSQAKFDKALLLEQLEDVAKALSEYSTLNDVTLGRKGPGRRGRAEKYHMIERERVASMLAPLDALDPGAADRDTLAALLADVRNQLRCIGAQPLRDMLSAVLESLPSLAQQLGKPTPEVVLADHDVMIKNQIGDLLHNVFMHLVRNSIDHGIEDAEQRVLAGKARQGSIRISAELREEALELAISDDGRGIALARIRAKAMAAGLLDGDTWDNRSTEDRDQMIGSLIFESGLSTASAVTDVSGRGVGMDAVREFVRREGGRIELRYLDMDAGADYRRFEILILLPSTLGVHANSPHRAAAATPSQSEPDAGVGRIGRSIPALMWT